MAQTIEEKVFRLSILILLVFAVLGIAFGIILKSEMILFDGIYSIVSIVISYITLRVTRYIKKKDREKFPFGKEGIEPFVVFIQYLFLNVMLLYMFVDGIQIILSGGNDVNLSLTIIYLMLTTTIQFFSVRKFAKIAKKSRSAIVKTEVFQWEISLKQSSFALAGYVVGAIFVAMKANNIAQYIDPIILIVFIVVTATQTMEEMLKAFKEIIGMSTVGKAAYKEIEGKIRQIKETYQIKDYEIRVRKVGGVVILEIDFLVDDNFKHGSVTEQDKIRDMVFDMIKEQHFDLWLSVGFTTKLKWIG